MLTNWFIAEKVTADDVALCRNTKPLVEEAYKMIAADVACRVEGRDIGEGLIQLAQKWKRITMLTELQTKLDEWREAEVKKWEAKQAFSKVQLIEDKVETLNIIITNLQDKGVNTVTELVQHIRNLFGDTPEGQKPRVFTLSTIHKSKGREWERVFILHPELIPSKYAKQDWQMEQEYNLLYVAITRAKSELIYVDA